MATSEPEALSDIRLPRLVRFDLSAAGGVYRRKVRPANRRRQKCVRFVGREGDEELYAFEQTFPVVGAQGRYPPSPAQLAAVHDYYGDGLPEDATGLQAHTMLCVRDYAWSVVRGLTLSAPRRQLLARFVAAFLCADPELRTEVRRWNEARRRELGHGIEAGIAYHRPYRTSAKFVEKVLNDLRGGGAEAFG